MRVRSYTELQQLQTFEDRFQYLALESRVGRETFGTERYLNQRFYTSYEWKTVRRHVLVRDLGSDLGVPGFEINHPVKAYIHHMNPMTVEQILDRDPAILDPEYLITITLRTHNAVHYGDARQIPRGFVERRPGDTTLW